MKDNRAATKKFIVRDPTGHSYTFSGENIAHIFDDEEDYDENGELTLRGFICTAGVGDRFVDDDGDEFTRTE